MNKGLSLISLAMKAGKVVSGEFMVESAIKSEEVCLCIVACDASENTKKKFRNMCTYRNIDLIEFGDKTILGHAIGKEIRATIGIVDEGFAKTIKSQLAL